MPFRKSLDEPDYSAEYGAAVEDVVAIGDFTVGRLVQQPGIRLENARPAACWRRVVCCTSCRSHSRGHLRVVLHDGTTIDLRANDVFEIPPGHDAWVVGDEPVVELDWSGLEAWTGFRMRLHERVLAGLLMTDLVGSTAEAERIGDAAWRDRLAAHHETLRSLLDRYGGREIDTAGDGMFALFDGAARALECAGRIRDNAEQQSLGVRIGVHVGEVELTTRAARGIAVHEVARITVSR
jgi:hypothetical protein